MSFRNPRFLLGSTGLIGIATLAIWRAGIALPADHPSKEVPRVSTEILFADEVESLEPGRPIERELKGGTGHRYEVDLTAGQYVHLVADQRGIDLVLRLRAPDGSVAGEVDSPSFDQGPEQLFVIPRASGRFRVEVVCKDSSAPAGHYAVRIEPPHPASEVERRHVGAFQLFQEGETLRRRDETDAARQAVAKYQEALAIWRQLGNDEWREWEAESLFEMGLVQQEQLREMDAALASLREALPLLQSLGKREEEGVALLRCGEVELRKGHLPEAIELHQQAAATLHAIGRTGQEAAALNGLGGAYSVAGEAQKGLEAHQLGLERARAAGDVPEEEAAALRGIGEILVNQGKLAAAMDSLQQALDVFRTHQAPLDAAYTLSRMAAISQRLGRLDDALSQLQEALGLLRRIEDKDGEVVALNSLGTVHLLRKETAKAGEVYTQALNLARSTGNRYGEAFSLLNLGRYRFDAGDPREALRFHEDAAALFQAMGFRRGEVSTLYGSARALYALGDYEAARQRLERVVDGVEALRDESENEDLRSSYFATKQHYFDLYIDVLMRLHERNPDAGFDTQALALNERRRARSLLEILTEAKTESQSPAGPERARQRRLQQQINAVEARLESARAAGRETSIVALEGKQSSLLVELADSEARSRGHDLEFAAAARPKPLALADMKKLVDPSSLLLVYSLGEERSFLWCLTSDGKLTSHPLPPRRKLEEVAGRVRAAWSRHGNESEAGARRAAWLSREILGPVADELGNQRLLIVADGALQTLPFAALPDPRDLSGNPGPDRAAAPLMAQNEVVHLPSISTLAVLRRESRRAAPPSWIGIVADPVFTSNDPRVLGGSSPAAGPPPGSSALTRAAADLEIPHFDRLPYTRVEAESIARFAPQSSRVALDFEASGELVKSDELKQYRILHFATHGLLNSRHPELSGLVLSLVDSQGNPKKDGFLLAHEIRNLDLRAQLVVLSACQTGLGSEVRGEGLVGLTHSFMSAGTPRIVVSLWNVNDEATAELMTRFYRGMIEKDLPPSEALRCAQLSIREQPEWRSPFYWAPFIFIGEWQTGARPDESFEKRVVRSHPPPIPDDDFSPPESKGAPLCPKLH